MLFGGGGGGEKTKKVTRYSLTKQNTLFDQNDQI